MAVMECRENQERIVLFLYEELTEHEQTQLETHLQACGACNDTFEQQKEFHAALAEDSGPWNVPSDLLVESRRALANELDRLERKPWNRGWWLEWTTLVAVGLAAGVFINSSGLRSGSSSSPSLATFNASGSGSEAVSNLRIVSSDAATGNVELVGDMVRPMHFQGNLQDDVAQQLLVGALRDGRNASSRMSAVEVLSRKSDDEQIKEALIRALIEDDNAGVRLKALQTLTPNATKDKEIQAAFLNVLANDSVAGIRRKAIDALQGLANDDSIASSVREATKNDDNVYIKIQAVQFGGNGQ
jgi:hypothetical protein